MSDQDIEKRLRDVESLLAVEMQKVKTLEGKVNNMSSGIGRALWIIGGGFISAMVAWVVGGGLDK